LKLVHIWKDLIMPTICAYIIACAILGEIVGFLYLYSNRSIGLKLLRELING
jgi:hypothetical protein